MKTNQIDYPKLRIVTHRDLNIAQQAVQLGHAGISFQHEHPEIAKDWHTSSNYLIFLSTDNENSLIQLIEKCKERNLSYTVFIEPDLNNAVTAVAIGPSEEARKITCSLPKAFKEVYNEA